MENPVRGSGCARNTRTHNRFGEHMRWLHALRSARWDRWSPLAVGLGAAFAMAARLTLPHPVGMANNGDAQRLMCQIGADAGSPPVPSARWFFVRFRYPVERRPAGCDGYPTTQIVQLRLTAWLHHHVFGLSGRVDLRETIVEYCLLVGVVMAIAAVLLASVRRTARFAVLAALFLLLGEATFADYAASPYSEAAALYGLLIFAVAAVVAAARGRGRRAAFLVAWGGALLAVGAKTETVTLAVPLALFLGTQRFEAGWLRGRMRSRAVPALCVLSLAATGAWSLTHESQSDLRTNVGNELTMTMMPTAADPGAMAVGLGLPRSFGRYSGTNWWSPHPIEDDPLYPRYQHRFTQANLGGYLAAHPLLADRVLSGGAGAFWLFRNTNIGTYPMGAGYIPESQECRMCLLLKAAHAMQWTGFPGVLVVWGVCLTLAGRLVRTSRQGSRRRAFGLVSLLLTGCAVAQYITAVYGEGNEVTKHLAVALFATALAYVWLAAGAAHTPAADDLAQPVAVRG